VKFVLDGAYEHAQLTHCKLPGGPTAIIDVLGEIGKVVKNMRINVTCCSKKPLHIIDTR
jgi:hypothetical protein